MVFQWIAPKIFYIQIMLQPTKIKGLTTELQCQLYFTQFGYNISVPLTEDCKYDFILDVNNRLFKIQVKTASLTKANTGISFSTRSTHLSTNGSVYHNYKEEEIDFFATYYNNICYLIPLSKCGISTKTLLFNPPKGLLQGDWIEDYEAPKILKFIFENEDQFDICQSKIDINKIKIKKEVVKIHQYSLDGEYLNTYSSYAEAGRIVGASDRSSHISQVCSGKRKTAYGFIWKKEIIEE